MNNNIPGPKRKRIHIHERKDLTADRVASLLNAAVRDRRRVLSKSTLELMARDFRALQDMVFLEVQWEFSLQLRKQLAEAIAALKQCVPALVKEIETARLMAERDGEHHAIPVFNAGWNNLADLALAAGKVERTSLLQEVEGRPAERRWEHYTDQILRTLQQHTPDLKGRPLYRFLATVALDITGEIVTLAAVQRAVERGNVMKWRNHSGENAVGANSIPISANGVGNDAASGSVHHEPERTREDNDG